MTALWSIWVVASLILAGSGFVPFFVETCGREFVESRGVFGAPNLDKSCSAGKDGIYHQQMEGNEHKRESCLVEFFSRPPSAGRRLRFRPTRMKTGLELI